MKMVVSTILLAVSIILLAASLISVSAATPHTTVEQGTFSYNQHAVIDRIEDNNIAVVEVTVENEPYTVDVVTYELQDCGINVEDDSTFVIEKVEAVCIGQHKDRVQFEIQIPDGVFQWQTSMDHVVGDIIVGDNYQIFHIDNQVYLLAYHI